MANSKPTELLITNRTIEYGGAMYTLHAVNKVFMGSAKVKRPFGIKVLFWTLVLLFVSVAMAGQNDSRAIGIIGAFLTGGFLLYAIYSDLQPTRVWALVFEVNSRNTNVVFTRDRGTVEEAIRQIRQALHSDQRFEQTIHFNSGQIVNANKIVGDIKYNDR